MTPSNSQSNVPNGIPNNAEISGYSTIRLFGEQSFLYVKHLILGKFGLTVIFTSWLKAFCNLVFVVVVPAAYKKMVRVYALSVIAFVENAILIIQKTVMNFPRNSMRQRGAIFSKPTKLSVSTIQRCSPNPTLPQVWHVAWYRAILVYSFPKSLFVSFKPLNVGIVKHKTKTHPAPQKCYRHIESRSCETGWKEVLSAMFLIGHNKAERIMTLKVQGVN